VQPQAVTGSSGLQTPRYSIGSATLPQGSLPEACATPRGMPYVSAVTPSTCPGGATPRLVPPLQAQPLRTLPAPTQQAMRQTHHLWHPQAQQQPPDLWYNSQVAQAQFIPPSQAHTPATPSTAPPPAPLPPPSQQAPQPQALWQFPQAQPSLRIATQDTAGACAAATNPPPPWPSQPSRSTSPAVQRLRSSSVDHVSYRASPAAPVSLAANTSAPTTPRFMGPEAEAVAMAKAAAAAAAKAAPGMHIVVRPVSSSQAALLTQRRPSAGHVSSPPPVEDTRCTNCNVQVAPHAVIGTHSGHKLCETGLAQGDHTAEKLRSCQAELAGLQKEVASLGQACRHFDV